MLYSGSCHCQKVKFKVELTIDKALSCNCTICRRKGTLLAFAPDSSFTLESGADNLTDYQFNKKVIHHTFCKTCGVTAFSSATMPDGTNMKAINVRCLDGVDLEKLPLQFYDGLHL